MAEVEVKPKAKAKKDDNQFMLILATIPLIGLLIFFFTNDEKEIVYHYAKQSCVLLLLDIFGVIPFIGWILHILSLVGWAMLLINALNGKEDYLLPVLGEHADKLIRKS